MADPATRHPVLITAGLFLVLAGMFWITQLTADSSFLAGAVGPLVLIGLGQGIAFGPLTAAGIAGAKTEDAGAASGVVNPSHELGSTLGVAILTCIAAGATTVQSRVAEVYGGGAVMIGIALGAALILIVPPEFAHRRATA